MLKKVEKSACHTQVIVVNKICFFIRNSKNGTKMNLLGFTC